MCCSRGTGMHREGWGMGTSSPGMTLSAGGVKQRVGWTSSQRRLQGSGGAGWGWNEACAVLRGASCSRMCWDSIQAVQRPWRSTKAASCHVQL